MMARSCIGLVDNPGGKGLIMYPSSDDTLAQPIREFRGGVARIVSMTVKGDLEQPYPIARSVLNPAQSCDC
jgi:hypothetical protein